MTDKIIKKIIRNPEKNARLFQNSILAPMRKDIINAYFRTQRVAEKCGLTPIELDNIWWTHCRGMDHVTFCKFMVSNYQEFRNTAIEKLREGLYDND